MFMLAILIIAMSVAAPKIAKEIQRDRELETMHRGKQYARAVKLYYKQFGRYPPNLDALVKTNEIRFLRRKYIDPTTGKDEWKAIQVGQQKTQTLGFFGQPIAGSSVGGVGPAGGNGLTGATPIGGIGSAGGIGSTLGSTDQGSTNGASGSSTDTSNGASGSQSGGTNSVAPGSGTGPVSGSSSAFATPGGQTGQTFGGAGIMGFSPTSPKQSILVYKKKNHYNEWEFLYDPIADQMMMQGGNTGTIGTPAGSLPGSSPIGGSSSFGGTSPIGSGSSFGTSNGTGTGSGASAPQPQQ
jgi:type II secretory pathway pseudopilin PulG